jgi:succinate dehydrogenase hydrophobic anchor subunit
LSVTAAPRTGPPFRLTLRSSAIVVAVLGLIVIYATDQVLPATTDRQAELRFWLAARATGVVALLLLTAQIVFGLVLGHPHNKTTWKLSKRIFPWHDHLWVFVMAFLAAHLVSLLADPKSGVDLAGAFIPGMSQYRSSPVALGTLALYAFLVTAITARYTKLLPAGAWLSLHRLALGDEQVQPLPGREVMLVAVLGDRHTLDEVHDEVGSAGAGRTGVEHAGDVGVVH